MKNARATVLDWRESKNGELIVFEEGQPLDSPDDQAAYKNYSGKRQLITIGLGSGFLLDHVVNTYPHLQITVIECRESLVGVKKRLYPQVNFVVIQSIDELTAHPDYKVFLNAEVEKFLFKKAAGLQLSFFQEIYWHLNLRTTEAIKNVTPLTKPLDDRWLINAKQLLESVEHENLPFKKTELLIVQELMK